MWNSSPGLTDMSQVETRNRALEPASNLGEEKQVSRKTGKERHRTNLGVHDTLTGDLWKVSIGPAIRSKLKLPL